MIPSGVWESSLTPVGALMLTQLSQIELTVIGMFYSLTEDGDTEPYHFSFNFVIFFEGGNYGFTHTARRGCHPAFPIS